MTETVTLEPKTRKAKNRLAEVARALPESNGLWEVQKKADGVAFDLAPGPWILVGPFSAPHGGFSRWVHETDDRDFVVRHNAALQVPAREAGRSPGSAGYTTDDKTE